MERLIELIIRLLLWYSKIVAEKDLENDSIPITGKNKRIASLTFDLNSKLAIVHKEVRLRSGRFVLYRCTYKGEPCQGHPEKIAFKV